MKLVIDGKPTQLKTDDVMVVRFIDHTVAFYRGGTPLRAWNGHDDKCVVRNGDDACSLLGHFGIGTVLFQETKEAQYYKLKQR